MPRPSQKPKPVSPETVRTATEAVLQADRESENESLSEAVTTATHPASEREPPSIAEIFGPGGHLEKAMPAGYEHRRSQLKMAELAEAAFRTKKHLIVEAGTGTGKTLAY